MRYHTRTFGAALALVFALTLATPVGTEAQGAGSPLTVDARGGIAIPEGGLKNLVDVGPSFGLGVAYRLSPRFSVRADGQLDLYGGADFETGTAAQSAAPDMSLWHFTGGVEYALLRPDRGRWDVTLQAGGGLTTIDSDAFVDGPLTNPRTGTVEADFLESYFSVNGALKAGYAVTDRTTVYAGVLWYWTLTDQDDAAVFTALGADGVWAFEETHSVPLTLGARMSF